MCMSAYAMNVNPRIWYADVRMAFIYQDVCMFEMEHSNVQKKQ